MKNHKDAKSDLPKAMNEAKQGLKYVQALGLKIKTETSTIITVEE